MQHMAWRTSSTWRPFTFGTNSACKPPNLFNPPQCIHVAAQRCQLVKLCAMHTIHKGLLSVSAVSSNLHFLYLWHCCVHVYRTEQYSEIDHGFHPMQLLTLFLSSSAQGWPP
eukprot:scpid79752/ scgid33353/ 